MGTSADTPPTVAPDGVIRFADTAALARAFPKLAHVTVVATGEAPAKGQVTTFRLVVEGRVDLPVAGKALSVVAGKSVLYFPAVPSEVQGTLPAPAPLPPAPVAASVPPAPRPAAPAVMVAQEPPQGPPPPRKPPPAVIMAEEKPQDLTPPRRPAPAVIMAEEKPQDLTPPRKPPPAVIMAEEKPQDLTPPRKPPPAVVMVEEPPKSLAPPRPTVPPEPPRPAAPPEPLLPPPLPMEASGLVRFDSREDLERRAPALVKDLGMVVRPQARRPSAWESRELTLEVQGLDGKVVLRADLVPFGTEDAALIFKDPKALKDGVERLRAGKTTAPPPPPPRLDDAGFITFASPPAFLAHAISILVNRGLMGEWAGSRAPGREKRQFALRVQGYPTEFPIQGEVVLYQAPTVAVTFYDVAPVTRLRDELKAAAAGQPVAEHGLVVAQSLPEVPRSAPPPVNMESVQAGFPIPTGDVTFQNPPGVDLVNQDLARLDAAKPLSLPAALLLLRQARASAYVVLKASRPVSLVLDNGLLLASDEDVLALNAAVLQVKLPAVVRPGKGPAAPGTSRRDPAEVAVGLVREQLRLMLTEELEMLLGHPRLGYLHKAKAVPGAYLPRWNPKEKRFLDVIIDGTRRVVDLPAVSGLARHVTFQSIILFKVFGLVEFKEEGVGGTASGAASVAAERRRLAAASLFERVGAHWSDHPAHIKQRYVEMQQKYGPRSRNAQAAPEECAAILKMALDALTQLSTAEGRRQARAALGSLDLTAAADILMRHAEMAAMRREGSAVLEYLQTSVELCPTQENTATLNRLMAALEAARAGQAVKFDMFKGSS